MEAISLHKTDCQGVSAVVKTGLIGVNRTGNVV